MIQFLHFKDLKESKLKTLQCGNKKIIHILGLNGKSPIA